MSATSSARLISAWLLTACAWPLWFWSIGASMTSDRCSSAQTTGTCNPHVQHVGVGLPWTCWAIGTAVHWVGVVLSAQGRSQGRAEAISRYLCVAGWAIAAAGWFAGATLLFQPTTVA